MARVLRSHVLSLLVVLLSLVLGVASNSDPCSVASTLHEADRRTKSSDPNNGVCDLRLNNTWFRVGTGKGSDIVTSCPSSLAGCGTLSPVWLNGAIPAVSDGEVKRTACVTSLKSCCEQVLTVGVKNCGDFRVWRLPPTQACPQAYCFEDPVSIATTPFPSTSSTDSGSSPSPAPSLTRSPSPNDNPHDDYHNNDDHNNDDDNIRDHNNDDEDHINEQKSLEGSEHVRRMRGMEVALGVVSTVLVLSLVLNGVLFCMYRARNQNHISSKARKYELPLEIAPPCTKAQSLSAPSTPPPPYKMSISADQPVVNWRVDKETLSRF